MSRARIARLARASRYREPVHGVAGFFEPLKQRPLEAELGRGFGPHGGGQLPGVPHQEQALLKVERKRSRERDSVSKQD